MKDWINPRLRPPQKLFWLENMTGWFVQLLVQLPKYIHCRGDKDLAFLLFSGVKMLRKTWLKCHSWWVHHCADWFLCHTAVCVNSWGVAFQPNARGRLPEKKECTHRLQITPACILAFSPAVVGLWEKCILTSWTSRQPRRGMPVQVFQTLVPEDLYCPLKQLSWQ